LVRIVEGFGSEVSELEDKEGRGEET